jgi:hypothetical protein
MFCGIEPKTLNFLLKRLCQIRTIIYIYIYIGFGFQRLEGHWGNMDHGKNEIMTRRKLKINF